MSTLTLELSDAQLQTLERLAQQRGTSIHALMLAIINDFTTQSELHAAYNVTHDPLYNIKSHDTGAPADLSQHADHYLYGATKR
jgi:hypothetical protein